MTYVTGLPTPYADEAYADLIIGDVEPWESADSNSRDRALQNGRMYLDDTYNVYNVNPDSPSDAVKTANSLFAEADLTASLFSSQDALGKPERGLSKKKTDASGVGTEKAYDPYLSNAWVDPYPQITAILASDGVYVSKGGIQSVPLIRG